MEEIEISSHAKQRMLRYSISEESVRLALQTPDDVLETYGGRKIYQKRNDGYIPRIIVEEHKGSKMVITVYPAKSDRYATV